MNRSIFSVAVIVLMALCALADEAPKAKAMVFRGSATKDVELSLTIEPTGHCLFELENKSNKEVDMGTGWMIQKNDPNSFGIPGSLFIQIRDRSGRLISVTKQCPDGLFSPLGMQSGSISIADRHSLVLKPRKKVSFEFELTRWVELLKTWAEEDWMKRELSDPYEFRILSISTPALGETANPLVAKVIIDTSWQRWVGPSDIQKEKDTHGSH